MLNQENFNRFITELNKRLTAKDPSCTITYSNNVTGGIAVRVDYDTGVDNYLIENTIVGARWVAIINV